MRWPPAEWLEYLDSLGVDAIILADVGTLALAAARPHVGGTSH